MPEMGFKRWIKQWYKCFVNYYPCEFKEICEMADLCKVVYDYWEKGGFDEH